MQKLLEDYKRRLLENKHKYEFTIDDRNATICDLQILEKEASCYRTFIDELEKVEKEDKVLINTLENKIQILKKNQDDTTRLLLRQSLSR